VRDGAAKGKVERNFRTLKDRWLNGFDISSITSLKEFNDELFSYINKHNTTVHSSTGISPIDSYKEDIQRIKTAKTYEWLENCFMNRITRKVNNDATISIDKVYFDVPMQFIKQKVEIRYLPDNMENAYIFFENQKYPIKKTNKVENSKTKRKNSLAISYQKENINV
jgi:putative transposase